MRGAPAAALFLLCLAVALAGCAALLGPSAEYPAIAPAPSSGAPVPVERTFSFEGGTETIAAGVDAGVLAGARANAKEVLVRGEVPEEEWVAGAYRAEILDPAQDGFWDELAAGFRAVRDRRGLDGDRYLELMAACVQQLPYAAAPGTDAKYPVETWADGSGDCDDKALLLAGLLSREGYRVALLVFPPESHMAVGVGCPDGYDYAGTGYAYLELTGPAYIGTVPTGIGDGIRIASAPIVVPIGNGTALYGAAGETAAIESARGQARATIDALGPEIERQNSMLAQERRSLESLRSAGARESFEAAHARYAAESAALDGLVDRYNLAVELLNRTGPGRYDRAGATAYVSAHPL